MGHNPSRTDLDRLIRTITNPDAIVSKLEKARCVASVNAYKTVMRRYRRAEAPERYVVARIGIIEAAHSVPPDSLGASTPSVQA